VISETESMLMNSES